MTALDFATETTQAASRPALLARGYDVVSTLFRAWMNRRAFYRLGNLSDSELSDIGLTRADLHVAVAGPLGMDPTARLRVVVEARRKSF